METKFNHFLVGAFVIIMSILIGSVGVWLVVGTERFEMIRYQVITEESVSGLSINSSVAFNGVDVGKVISINLKPSDPRFVVIELDIKEGTPIKEDTLAVLQSRGITGLVNLSLTGGQPESATLSPTRENPIPTIANGPSLGRRLDDAFTQIMSSISDISQNLSYFLNKENADAISQTLANLEQLTNRLAGSSDEVTDLINDLSVMTTMIKNKLMTATDAKGGTAVDTLIAVLDEIRYTVKDYAKLSDQISGFIQQMKALSQTADNSLRQNAPQLNALLQDIRILTESLQRVSNQVERNPQRFILGEQPPHTTQGASQ